MPARKRLAETQAAPAAPRAQPAADDHTAGITDEYLHADAVKAAIRDGQPERLAALLALKTAPGPLPEAAIADAICCCATGFSGQVKKSKWAQLVRCTEVVLNALPADAFTRMQETDDIFGRHNPWRYLGPESCPQVVELLIRRGVKPTPPQKPELARFTQPPYRFVAEKGTADVLRAFISNGGPGAAEALKDGSLLATAAERRSPQCVEVLLAMGAKRDGVWCGKTMMEWARTSSKSAARERVIALLQNGPGATR